MKPLLMDPLTRVGFFCIAICKSQLPSVIGENRTCGRFSPCITRKKHRINAYAFHSLLRKGLLCFLVFFLFIPLFIRFPPFREECFKREEKHLLSFVVLSPISVHTEMGPAEHLNGFAVSSYARFSKQITASPKTEDAVTNTINPRKDVHQSCHDTSYTYSTTD